MIIQLERLKQSLLELSEFGKQPNGGVTRISYSEEYEQAVDYVAKKMQQIGMDVWRDPIGNLFGKLQGRVDDVILLGSHIDSVPNGGMFDGCLGVMGALEVVYSISRQKESLYHSIVVAAFIDEEGGAVLGTLGSKSFCGQDFSEFLSEEKLHKVNRTVEDIRASRGDLSRVRFYLEMHIEQGGILEQEHLSLGLVEGIVGILRFSVSVPGKANHAGCTPMHLREDALRKAINIIETLYRMTEETQSNMVATVGQLVVYPGAANVIPGKVEFVIELRNMDRDRMLSVIHSLSDAVKQSGAKFKQIMEEPSVKMAPEIVDTLETAANALGYSWKRMVSGAGHDAIPLAQKTRAGMIFIPSINGVSHCPEEFSKWEDVETGTNLLLDTVLRLDKMR